MLRAVITYWYINFTMIKNKTSFLKIVLICFFFILKRFMLNCMNINMNSCTFFNKCSMLKAIASYLNFHVVKCFVNWCHVVLASIVGRWIRHAGRSAALVCLACRVVVVRCCAWWLKTCWRIPRIGLRRSSRRIARWRRLKH